MAVYTVEKKGGSRAISGFFDLPQLRRLQFDSGSISACPLMHSWRRQPGLCTQGRSVDVLMCHLCVDGGEKATWKCGWVGAKHTHTPSNLTTRG